VKVRVFHASRLPPSARRPAAIARACRRAMKDEGKACKGDLNVIIMDRAGMLRLNKTYLSHSHDTDVIAFPYVDRPGPDEPFGDIYISAHRARLQAAEQRHSVLREVLTLAIHGTLHLLGYRDDTPLRKSAMFRKQDALLGNIRA
jgi:probable rRNA maturation factor